MLTELLEHDHGQQIGTGMATRNDVEGCWGLADTLAIAAGELLTDSLDHLPLAGDDFKGFGDVLA